MFVIYVRLLLLLIVGGTWYAVVRNVVCRVLGQARQEHTLLLLLITVRLSSLIL